MLRGKPLICLLCSLQNADCTELICLLINFEVFVLVKVKVLNVMTMNTFKPKQFVSDRGPSGGACYRGNILW